MSQSTHIFFRTLTSADFDQVAIDVSSLLRVEPLDHAIVTISGRGVRLSAMGMRIDLEGEHQFVNSGEVRCEDYPFVFDVSAWVRKFDRVLARDLEIKYAQYLGVLLFERLAWESMVVDDLTRVIAVFSH